MANILQFLGILIAVPNAMFTVAPLLHASSSGKVTPTYAFLPIMVIGIVLFVIGRRMDLQQKAANK